MYELLILGTLMSGDMSGYKLRKILGIALVPRRKISNGVMYPLLKRLEADGFIQQRAAPGSTRGTKVSHITARGREHFQALMAAPVTTDVRRESVYQFKVRGFADVQPDVQRTILTAFGDMVQTDLDEYLRARKHLETFLATENNPESRVAHLEWTIQTLDLNIELSKTKQRWLRCCLQKINSSTEKEMNNGK
ncbi:PadR family transcriptional regulator [Lacticaseibacillus thailandensis]|nr:PadR family transcriptional regulator [Lacticaseibacillus thailandensis]